MSIGNANIHQVSEIPEITKLPNGRLRVVRRFNKFTREDVDNANYGSLLGDFGDLDTEGQQIVNQGYTNLKLISVEVDSRFNAVTNNSNAVLVKTYETLTSSFVQVTDEDQIEELENGTKRITRVLRAQSGTTYTGNVGTTNAGNSNTSFILAKSDLKDSGAFAELTLTFFKQDTVLSITEDKIGSQNAIVNEIFNPSNETITGKDTDGTDLSGYSEADRTESNHDGIKTIRVRFLQDDVVLSRSRDSVGSQKSVVLEVFNGNNEASDANSYGAGSGYVLAREDESNIDGIKTRRYTYLQPSILSVEESKNTPENRITVRVFDLASNHSSVSASTGAVVDTDTHILVSQSDQDYEGIKTSVYVFESKDYSTQSTNEFGRTVIDQVEQSTSTFYLLDQSNEYTIGVVGNLRILNQRIENDENEVNKRITKFTTVGIDNVSEDIVGSQKAIVITKVGAEPTTAEASSYSDISYDSSLDWSIAKKDNSRSSGLDVYTYTFLLNNTILSQSKDEQNSLKTEVIEVFNPKVTIEGLTLEGGSNVAGNYFLKTQQFGGKNIYTQSQGDYFPKTVSYNTNDSAWKVSQHSGVYAVSTDTNSENEIDPPLTGWNGTGTNEVTNIIFREFDQTLPNSTYGYELSHRYDKEGYSLIDIQRSNLDGIPTMRYTFAKPSILSVVQDFVEDVNTIQVTAFNKTESEVKTDLDEVTTNHKLINQRENNHDGIITTTFTFEINTSDVVSYTANNRLQVVRTVYEANDYNYNSNYDVGTTSITFADAGNTTLVLSELRVNKRGATGTFVKLEAVFTEPGESARSKSIGPNGLPGTERITITSSGSSAVTLTETDDIKLVNEQEQNNNGFNTFVRSYIKGTDATTTTTSYVSGRTYKIATNNDYSSVGGPSSGIIGDYFQANTTGQWFASYLVGEITGTKITYDDIISVPVPGTVKCKQKNAESSQITEFENEGRLSAKSQAFMEVIPPSEKKITVNVTESILTSIPTITQLAYNLDDINCSVTKLKTFVAENPGNNAQVTVTSGSSTSTSGASGFSRNIQFNTNNSYFPGCYLLDSNTIPSSVIKQGLLYRITATSGGTGNSLFTDLGADENTVNHVFVATSNGTSSGKARWLGSEGTFTYMSAKTVYVNNSSINSNTGSSNQKSELVPTGTTAQSNGSAPSTYVTTGVIQQKARPVLTTLDGTTYYEVIKFSKS